MNCEEKITQVSFKLDGYDIREVYSCSRHGAGISSNDYTRCKEEKNHTYYCPAWRYGILVCNYHTEYFDKVRGMKKIF